jgi:hypothetical protein
LLWILKGRSIVASTAGPILLFMTILFQRLFFEPSLIDFSMFHDYLVVFLSGFCEFVLSLWKNGCLLTVDCV